MNVPIVGESSLTALRIKSFTNPELILMSLNAVPNAVRQGRHSGTETVAAAMAIADMGIVHPARCSLQYAPIVARKRKYHSNHDKTDQYIAAIVSVK